MLESYDDIRRRIPEPPKWFDAHGVPRYDEFHPSMSVNVYAQEVLLYEIECQNCQRRMLVEANWSRHRTLSIRRGNPDASLTHRVQTKDIGFGDPPCFAEDCGAGAVMMSDPIRTVQFWRRDAAHDWARVPELEGVDLAS